MDSTELNTISLCAGGAGLDLGLELALGITRTVCWVEWEAFAVEYLASRMEAECLHPAPIWTDLRTFDGKPWRGVVDCLTAGYPCQPFSLAGRRGGSDDPRHLWPHVHRVIGEVEPRIVFLENVGGHLSLGAEQVFTELQGLDYEVAAGLFTAAEVGASHKRERLFILAMANPEHAEGRRGASRAGAGNRVIATGTSREVCGCPDGDVLADATGERLRRNSRVVAQTERCASGIQAEGGQREVSVYECERMVFPPGPEDTQGWQGVPYHLWPATEPALCELAHGLAHDRTRWLKLLGNGVVPLQAAYAFVSLWSVLRERVR